MGTGGWGQGRVGTFPSLDILCTFELGILFTQHLFLKVTFINHGAMFTFFPSSCFSCLLYSSLHRVQSAQRHMGQGPRMRGIIPDQVFGISHTSCPLLILTQVLLLTGISVLCAKQSKTCLSSMLQRVRTIHLSNSSPGEMMSHSRALPAHRRCSAVMPQFRRAGAVP